MDAILELTLNIREKPAMYLGCVSLKRLSAFVAGYQLALYKNGVNYEQSMNWGRFIEYVHKKYKIPLSTRNAESIISMIEPDDETAFYKYYECLEEFLNKYPRFRK